MTKQEVKIRKEIIDENRCELCEHVCVDYSQGPSHPDRLEGLHRTNEP